ncbi:PIG-L deacetylase family protein [Paenibacillus hamazuiensis]|uniref:PIG-L deacetylase family protein n=1 Tax=Paenibacillus hamazuiensis TaxID=2936508 RepID=UPI00200C70ED|nr:PIG-L family deacetylase [Paenibacillus hamazuiensis]
MTAKVAFLFAHPDDETFLCSCLIRKLADAQVPVSLLLATKGDAGYKNGYVKDLNLTREQLGAIRVREMEEAARILGIPQEAVQFLDFPDGQLQEADPDEFLRQVTAFLQRHEPQVVVTFPPDGGNGHRDHIAISQVTTKAVLGGGGPSVQKLYYCSSPALELSGHLPSVRLDTADMWAMKAEALKAHRSQLLAIERAFGTLDKVPEARRYEEFVLAWERGIRWPKKTEKSVLDGLHDDTNHS